MKIKNIKEFYRQNLPHIQPIGACFFVTFRLKDSIPIQLLEELKEKFDLKYKQIMLSNSQYKNADLYRERKLFFAEYDSLLDSIKDGPTYLKEPKIAKIVIDELHRFDGSNYKLLAYTIMSNHVHILIDTSVQIPENFKIENYFNLEFKPLSEIMKQIKGASGRYANLALNKKGSFWQQESYDHYVRDNRELINIIGYILNNPVKAKIVEKWEDHKFSYYVDSKSTRKS